MKSKKTRFFEPVDADLLGFQLFGVRNIPARMQKMMPESVTVGNWEKNAAIDFHSSGYPQTFAMNRHERSVESHLCNWCQFVPCRLILFHPSFKVSNKSRTRLGV